ncbi:hypothetical protein H2201_007071 [Coniosporium apollinis]|uniref:Adhesin domain-containing protein n=1 Tax=Coniosporium apollinis TaxID=61459 RepID=A0ABQ9NLU3_9PEZI|nr:hypothetical protein H2201_007071 [Coniosporium apollinis]
MNPSPEKDEPRRESIAEGPTDGYFNRRQHPQDLYVQTPASSAADSKGNTAAEYAGSSDSSPSQSQVIYTPTSTTRSGETTPLMERGAPPAYTDIASAPIPAAEKPAASTSGLSDSPHADKREDIGDANDLDTDPRRTIINVGTGSVSGKYALRDYLSIRTTTGSISITVDPQPADPASPKPAVFEAYAKRGSIRVDFPTRGTIPDREYEVTVHSDTGSISGTFIHGRHTSLSATTGSISAKILPCGAGNASELRTEALTGATTVTLLAPYKDPGTVMGGLESSHKSKSGSMKLVYPQEWEGTVEGRTASGSVGLHGRDLEVVREDKGWVGKHVVAKKGKGNSRMTFDVVSGSVTAQIGDL